MVVIFDKALHDEIEFENISSGECFRFTGKDNYKDSFNLNIIFIKCSTMEIVDLKTGVVYSDIEGDRAVEKLDAEIIIHNSERTGG